MFLIYGGWVKFETLLRSLVEKPQEFVSKMEPKKKKKKKVDKYEKNVSSLTNREYSFICKYLT